MKCAGFATPEYHYLVNFIGENNYLLDSATNSSSSSLSSSSCARLSDVDPNATVILLQELCRLPSVTSTSGYVEVGLPPYSIVEEVIYNWIIPLVCIFGIIGNCLNLVALTGMIVTHRTPMERMERSATVGLLALAVADLFFCIVVLPLAFVNMVDGKSIPPPNHLTFELVYQVYHGALIGLFITLSTWLTVIMAVGRYLAICRPLHARSIIGTRFTVFSIVAAVAASLVLNVPRFFYDVVACVEHPTASDGASRFYFPFPGFLKRHATLDQVYHAAFLVAGIAVPLAVLAYCNFFLIRAIRISIQMRRRFQQQTTNALGHRTTPTPRIESNAASAQGLMSKRPSFAVESSCADSAESRAEKQHKRESKTNVITLTMTIIVIMNVVMVTPAEVSNVFTQMINLYVGEQSADAPDEGDSELQQSSSITHVYNVFSAVANTLQTLNFACNFILYCAVNVHFRRMLHQLAVMFTLGCGLSCCGERTGNADGGYSPPSNVRRNAPHRQLNGGHSMLEMTAVSSIADAEKDERPTRHPMQKQTRNLLTPNYVP